MSSTLSDRWTGDDHCGFCHQGYVLELEVYCVECDRPVCPLCATRLRVHAALRCPECAGRGESAEGEDG